MRVLVFSHSSATENLGGAERALLEFIDRWKEASSSVEFFVVTRKPEGLLQAELLVRKVEWLSLQFESWVLPQHVTGVENKYRKVREDSLALRSLIRFCEGYRPDLVISNTIVAPWGALAAKTLGLPHAWFVHEFGDGHVFEMGIEKTFEDIGTLSDEVITSSFTLKDYVSRWIPETKISVMYPLPPLEDIVPDRRVETAARHKIFTDEQGTLRAVLIGRVSALKGQGTLLDAAAVLKERGHRLEVAMVGHVSESEKETLISRAVSSGIDSQVFFTGEVENTSVYVEQADFGVVASASEGFGRATAEMMAAGLAVIGSRAGATPELVIDEVTGFLFEPNDSVMLADRIETYFTNPHLLKTHGLAGREHAESRIYSANRFAGVLNRLEAFEGRPGRVMAKWPNIFESWLDYPAIISDYLVEEGVFANSRQRTAWKVGVAVLTPVRLLRNAISTLKRGLV